MTHSIAEAGMSEFQMLIDGRMVDGASTLPVINPATGAVAAVAPGASADQLDAAVAAAGRAYAGWRRTSWQERLGVLEAMIVAIQAAREPLARLLTLEQGKPLAAAFGEIDAMIDYTRFFMSLRLEPEIRFDDATRYVEIRREPLGVVAAIVPWNYPLLLTAFKLPPALLAGNTLVLKPAPTTPLATLYVARLIAGIMPPGVVNVISGDDALGPLLTAHLGVQKISFTGSTGTGKKVMAAAANSLARLTLELGGNDAAIVLDASDIPGTAAKLFASAFGNSGQVCRAIKRLYVPRPLCAAIAAALAECARAAVVGDGVAAGTQFGPVQNAAQFNRLKAFYAEATRRGDVMPGGGPVEGPGYMFRPTIVTNIPHDSSLVQDEQFGPILPVIAYDDVSEAVTMANSTPYGLSASVWSADVAAAMAVADDLIAGTVWINKHSDRVPEIPIAGALQSGFGVELGREGLSEFTQLKVVNVARGA